MLHRREDHTPGEDYLLRLIKQVGEFLARVVQQREAGRPDEALVTAMLAQERLFGRPLAEFGAWSVEEQVEHLIAGETPADAATKCALYADLLAEAARVYGLRGPAPLETTARQLAVWVLLHARDRLPDAAEDLQGRAARLAGELGADGLTDALARTLAADRGSGGD